MYSPCQPRARWTDILSRMQCVYETEAFPTTIHAFGTTLDFGFSVLLAIERRCARLALSGGGWPKLGTCRHEPALFSSAKSLPSLFVFRVARDILHTDAPKRLAH